ncbi:MAG: type II toxin-antitoxin system PemK/MazF family toxin [Candidatus Rokuibacteriota bacterium]
MKRGEIFWAELKPRSGPEQRGRRPVIIVSNDGFNLTPLWRSVVVVPVSTSETQAQRGPSAVSLPAGTGGLPRASVALCHQVTTLDRTKLAERAGLLPAALLVAVEEGLKATLDLD